MTRNELPLSDIQVGSRIRQKLTAIDTLAASLKERGLLQPIVVDHENRLLAGRRRLEAAKLLGWPQIPVYRLDLSSLDDHALLLESLHVERSENVERVNFTPEEIIRASEEIARRAKEAARRRQASAGPREGRGKKPMATGCGNFPPPVRTKTRDEVAAAFGLSGKTYDKAKQVVAAADANPTLRPLVDRMNATGKVDSAYKAVKAAEEKAKVVEAARSVSLDPAAFDLRHCSMQDLLAGDIAIDHIVTDPPYPEEYLPLYGELARLAKRALKPHGVLAVMCGQSYLPQILAAMSAHMTYRWTAAYLTPGGQAVQLWERKVNTFWKPVLIFGGSSDWIGDVVRSDVNDNDKRFHGWGQSASGMVRLIEALTKPGDRVCDPFMGAGTTGVACAATHRRFLGCDIDSSQVEIARGRIAGVVGA